MATTTTHPHTNAGINTWTTAWRNALPALAMLGPGSWFVAALIRAAGIDTLDGDLDWVSAPEGVVMAFGAPFFVATFILLGLTVARAASRTGIAITALGVLGTSFLSGIAWFRVYMAKFVEEGLDADAMNDAFETPHIWDIVALTNLCNFGAWIVAGIVILKTAVVPRWVGLCCLGGVIAVPVGQAAYIATEFFWPLGTGLWLLATIGAAGAYRQTN